MVFVEPVFFLFVSFITYIFVDVLPGRGGCGNVGGVIEWVGVFLVVWYKVETHGCGFVEFGGYGVCVPEFHDFVEFIVWEDNQFATVCKEGGDCIGEPFVTVAMVTFKVECVEEVVV